jgi:undecaprenyl-diphosphatase
MFGTGLLISLWNSIDEWDKWLFVKINNQWTNSFFDLIMPYFRDSVFWAPLYIFILAFIALNFGRKGWWWSLAFIITIVICDQVSSTLLKPMIARYRPCQDPEFFNQVRLLLKRCSGSFSFTSSHAANHFGIATFMVFTFRGIFRHWMYLAYVWAFLIAYAQVYVGVHYPTDVLGGALIGFMAGVLTAWVFNKKMGTFNLDNLIA